MKTKKELIESIIVNSANFEYCAKKGKINGSLLADIERIMQTYHEQQLIITGVSQQRELLIAFFDSVDDADIEKQKDARGWEVVDNYLKAINCG